MMRAALALLMSTLVLPERRRVLVRFIIGAVVFAVVGLATLAGILASRDMDAIAQDLRQRLQVASGGAISVGKSRVRLFPTPRIELQDVGFTTPDGSLAIEARSALVRPSLFDLIDGRIDMPGIALIEPIVRVNAGRLERFHASPRAIMDVVGHVASLFKADSAPARLNISVAGARFEVTQQQGEAPLVLSPVNGRLRYSRSDGEIALNLRRNTAIRPFDIALTLPCERDLAPGRKRKTSLTASGFGSRIAFAGTLSRDPDLVFSGKLDLVLDGLLQSILRTGDMNPRAKDDDRILIGTQVTFDPRGIWFDALRLEQAGRSLSGIAAMREASERWNFSATLAGDLVDGSATRAALSRLRQPDGQWSATPLALDPSPGIDLDIRLSTREFRFGGLAFTDAAVSILTRKGRSEFSIAEARFGAGIFKSRITLAEKPDGGSDLRFSITGEKIDSEAFLEKAFGLSRIKGIGQFVFQGEAHGRTIAELVGSLNGHGQIEIGKGEVAGFDINRLQARIAETRPELALVAALGGRTTFETLLITGTIRKGIIEPSGSRFVSTRVEAGIEGEVSLAEQKHRLALILRRRQPEGAGAPAEFFGFRIQGPLLSPSVKPDIGLVQKPG